MTDLFVVSQILSTSICAGPCDLRFSSISVGLALMRCPVTEHRPILGVSKPRLWIHHNLDTDKALTEDGRTNVTVVTFWTSGSF